MSNNHTLAGVNSPKIIFVLRLETINAQYPLSPIDVCFKGDILLLKSLFPSHRTKIHFRGVYTRRSMTAATCE